MKYIFSSALHQLAFLAGGEDGRGEDWHPRRKRPTGLRVCHSLAQGGYLVGWPKLRSTDWPNPPSSFKTTQAPSMPLSLKCALPPRRGESQSKSRDNAAAADDEDDMPSSPPSSLCSSLLLLLLSLSPHSFLLSSSHPTAPFKGVSLDNPVLQLASSSPCERVRVTGLSRLYLKSYPSSLHVTVNASAATIPERVLGKIDVCFHRNASRGLCQCEQEQWQVLQKGRWSWVMSPYDVRYIDVRAKEKASGSVTVSIEEDFQQWRLVFLGLGFILFLAAPVVSNWVPFYYSSSMALGVLLVVLLILFQGMKLLPMGRKNILYLTLYGSLLGVGSFVAHYFSTVVNSILANFGLSEEMHNPVSVFLLVGIILAGAALGFWIVRKFVLSGDGSVDAGIAQFVKWAMRILAIVFVFQSTLDSLLAVAALVSCWSISFLVTSRTWRRQQKFPGNENLWLRRPTQASINNRQAEFLSRSTLRNAGRTVRGNPNSVRGWSDSPIKGLVYRSPQKLSQQHADYYSSYHKTPTPRKFTKKGWEDFTRESTSEALTDWASTPEVGKWLADNAHRIRLEKDTSSDESMESSSGSSEETTETGSCLNFLKWY